ncbi:FAD binding domain-containing protein [Xylogone sp. PMI_703]|nr:FAD binding domain-containing protein [Xylogone sp. PMI_703]
MSRPSVIIVGSGLAGLSAASELIARGVEVKLLERASKPGGNSMKASSGINGAPTRWQPGPPLSDTFFYDDTLKSVGEVLSTAKKQRESLVATLTNSSSDAVDWLVDEKGVDLSVVAQLGGHSFPRTHRGAGKTPPGAAIVTTLLTKLKESGKFELSTHCVVTKILKPGHVVEGVEYESHGEKRVLEGPVIFTTGGFAGDAHGLLAKYRPDLAGFPSTNEARPGSQPLLTEVGAGLLDMKEVQIHPTSFVDPKDILNPVKFLAAEVLRGEGGLLLYNGKRFVNEMETRKNVTGAFLKLPIADPDPKQFDVQLVVDEGVYRSSSSHIDFYVWKGLMKRMTLTELGTQAIEAVREYSFVAEGKKQDPFGRQSFGHWELKPEDVGEGTVVYVGRVTPAVHFTMGGVTINDKSQVLDEQGNAVNGLWAAGEVTGGVHGQNRLGGSSLLECVVFGRTAGREAAKFVGI